MYKFKNSLVAFGGFVLLIGAISLVTPRVGFGRKSAAHPSPGPPTQNVNIVNTPNVNVANTVRVSEARRQPFDARIDMTFSDGPNGIEGVLTTVPPGKQLVVTYASASATLTVATKAGFRILKSNSVGTVAFYELVPVATDTLSGIVASEPLHIYLDAGDSLSVVASRNSLTGSGHVNVSVSGYLVDVP